MSIRRVIANALVIAFGLLLIFHFAMIWIYGEVFIYETNKVILALETVMGIAILYLGFNQLLKTFGEIKEVRKIIRKGGDTR